MSIMKGDTRMYLNRETMKNIVEFYFHSRLFNQQEPNREVPTVKSVRWSTSNRAYEVVITHPNQN